MPKFQVDLISGANGTLESLFVDAADTLDAAREAYKTGGVPVAVHTVQSGFLGRLQNPIGEGGKSIGIDALSLFSEQLAELLDAGLPLEQGLLLLSGQDLGSPQSRLANRLLRKVRAGDSLTHALNQEQGISGAFVGIVQGAERGGTLAAGFATLARYLERQTEISRRITGALSYPLVVLVITIFAVFFILAVVIPEFAPLFAGEEKRLPAVTRIVLFFSDMLVNELPALLLGSAFLGMTGYLCFSRVIPLRTYVRKTFIRLPPVQYAIRLELARTIQVLGALLSSGVEASEAMDLAAAAVSNAAIRKQFIDSARSLREGRSITDTFSAMPYLPQSVVTLIAVGERSGDLGRVVTRSALVLESDTNRRIDKFLGILNPATVITLGGFVAVLIASVMLGILSINQLAMR